MPAQLKVIRKVVATAGTQLQVTATTGTWVFWAVFSAERSAYIGNSDVSATTGRRILSMDDDLVIPPYATVPQQPLDLSTVWVDVDTDGDAVQVVYLEAS
jgi:hypothetical protein